MFIVDEGRLSLTRLDVDELLTDVFDERDCMVAVGRSTRDSLLRDDIVEVGRSTLWRVAELERSTLWRVALLRDCIVADEELRSTLWRDSLLRDVAIVELPVDTGRRP